MKVVLLLCGGDRQKAAEAVILKRLKPPASGGQNDEKIHDYDPAAALDGPEAIAIFMADALRLATLNTSLRHWELLPAPKA